MVCCCNKKFFRHLLNFCPMQPACRAQKSPPAKARGLENLIAGNLISLINLGTTSRNQRSGSLNLKLDPALLFAASSGFPFASTFFLAALLTGRGTFIRGFAGSSLGTATTNGAGGNLFATLLLFTALPSLTFASTFFLTALLAGRNTFIRIFAGSSLGTATTNRAGGNLFATLLLFAALPSLTFASTFFLAALLAGRNTFIRGFAGSSLGTATTNRAGCDLSTISAASGAGNSNYRKHQKRNE